MTYNTPSPIQANIAVIIVNYGTAKLAIASANSVLAKTGYNGRVTVHLVDNGSPSADAAAFQQTFGGAKNDGRVVLYLEDKNHGFGRGNNIVLNALSRESTPPDYVFLLNPDAQLDNEAHAVLATVLDEQPQIAAVGAGISLPSGQPVPAAFRFPSATAEFARALNFGPISSLMKNAAVALPPDHPEGSVDWVAGAAVMFRYDVLQAMGGFDPAFFLYFEEVDLMRRIRAAGHEIHYIPRAKVLHAEGAATKLRSGDSGRRAKPAYWYDSWRIYFRKSHGRAGALWAATAWMVGASLNCVISLLRRNQPQMPLHFFHDITRRVLIPLMTPDQKGPV